MLEMPTGDFEQASMKHWSSACCQGDTAAPALQKLKVVVSELELARAS